MLWQSQMSLYVRGTTATRPCFVFNVGLVVPMWDGWKDLLLPPASAPQISVGKSSLSPFAILLNWQEADTSLLHCAQAFRLCLAPNYPELLLKKKSEDLVHMNLCEEGCLNLNMNGRWTSSWAELLMYINPNTYIIDAFFALWQVVVNKAT